MSSIRKRLGRKRPDGTRRTSWILDVGTKAGTRIRKTFHSKAEAEDARGNHFADLRSGSTDLPPLLFKDAAEDYLKIIEKVGRNGRLPVSPETAHDYGKTVDLHLIPRVGEQDIAKNTAPDVVAMRDALALDPDLGHSTRKKCFMHYVGIHQEAFNRGRIRNNVWSGISLATTPAIRAAFADEIGGSRRSMPSRTEVSILLKTSAQLREDPRPLLDDTKGWRAIQAAWAKYHVLLLTAVLT
ncbi:MAG: hypothetical protein V7727_20135, partial [Sneathiella sp.]